MAASNWLSGKSNAATRTEVVGLDRRAGSLRPEQAASTTDATASMATSPRSWHRMTGRSRSAVRAEESEAEVTNGPPPREACARPLRYRLGQVNRPPGGIHGDNLRRGRRHDRRNGARTTPGGVVRAPPAPVRRTAAAAPPAQPDQRVLA